MLENLFMTANFLGKIISRLVNRQSAGNSLEISKYRYIEWGASETTRETPIRYLSNGVMI